MTPLLKLTGYKNQRPEYSVDDFNGALIATLTPAAEDGWFLCWYNGAQHGKIIKLPTMERVFMEIAEILQGDFTHVASIISDDSKAERYYAGGVFYLLYISGPQAGYFEKEVSS